MKKCFSVFAAVALCLSLCLTTVSALTFPIVKLGDSNSEETAPEAEIDADPAVNDEKSSSDLLPSVSIAEDLVEKAPMEESIHHTAAEVREIVGESVEIINIDGLDVPLSDGSMFHIPFVDIAEDAYYTDAVAWAYANDITAGVTELSFGPNLTCTRGQMVTFLWRAAGFPEPASLDTGFSDVVNGSYYAKAVAWAVENKITDGVGGGKFDPDGIVNRAQAVTFLYRAKGGTATAAASGFTDVAGDAFYADAVAWAVANDVTTGVGGNAFAPDANCVRGQTVTFLYRAYQ